MYKTFSIISLTVALSIVGCRNSDGLSTAIYKDPSAPVESRVEDLLGRMTTEEKIWQLTQGVIGKNDNPNNLGADRHSSPEIGSVIASSSHWLPNCIQFIDRQFQ